MPSTWKYFCCICQNADNKRSQSARYTPTHRRLDKRRSKSGKNTWTRRSLLENEQNELMEVPPEQMPYQMRATDTPTYEYDRLSDGSREERVSDVSVKRNVLEASESSFSDSNYSHVSKTTFPWMDEKFVPNGRSGTRLGISSVQLNAKRREPILKKTQPLHQNSVPNNSPRKGFAPYKQMSVSFSEDEPTQIKPSNYVSHGINPNYIPSNFRNLQSSHVIRNEIHAAPSLQGITKTPVHAIASHNYANKPMVLKAPTSEIGVRRVSSNHAHPHREEHIPKLEDFTGHPVVNVPWREEKSSYQRPSVLGIFPKADDFGNARVEEGPTHIWSEVTLKKPDHDSTKSEVSLKRSDEPDIFFPKTNKYERLKSHSTKTKEKPKTKTDKMRSESMYGYVPKVVQNVHASTALEGTQIDDFFRQTFSDQNQENYSASWDDLVNNSDDEPYIITTVVDSTVNLAVTDNEKIIGSKSNLEVTEISRDKEVPTKAGDFLMGSVIDKPREQEHNIGLKSIKTTPTENSIQPLNNTATSAERVEARRYIQATKQILLAEPKSSNVHKNDKKQWPVSKTKIATKDGNTNVENFYFPGIEPASKSKENTPKATETRKMVIDNKEFFKTENGPSKRDEKGIKNEKKEEIENNVIMIDFPPNLDNDKNISKVKMFSSKTNKASSEVGTSGTKVAANISKEADVLY